MGTNGKKKTTSRTTSSWITGVLLGAAVLLLAGFARAADEPVTPPDAAKKAEPTMEERWGVKVIGIHLSAAGYMLDFRYRVLDPTKAGPLFDLQIKPCLIDQATGARMMVLSPPKLGAMRSSAKSVIADRNYFIMFANPGQYIKAGSKVTVEIGQFKAEDLTVQ
jgi:hypothetical protein